MLLLCVLGICSAAVPAASPQDHPVREVTILYTNDFHSAVNPIPAYWLPGSPKLGGAAQLAALVNQIRKREKPVFLFDSGDMFTGMLSTLTRGEALMEMMISMHYDAMAIGNHEFDYGSENFVRQMNRVPFPVLGANIFYKGTNHPYSRPYAIVERDGIRVGVVGIIGQDAATVALPSGVANLDFLDPVPVVRAAAGALRPQVDLIVVLAHQGKTGPMQTDAEARPELQRDFDEDIRLSGEVPGIDVFVGGHAHRGIETPYVHAKTGTLIVQTYGFGTRLGYLKLRVKDRRVIAHEGELLKVWSDRLAPDPIVAEKMRRYREMAAPQIGEVVGRSKVRLVRDYLAESPLGDFVSDVLRAESGAEVAIMNAGGLRADLPEGAVTKGDVLDALPFDNNLVVCQMTGAEIREVLERGLSLERGMVQVSGLRAVFDLHRPVGNRLVELEIGGQPAGDAKVYRVATNSFLAEGGDLYQIFRRTKQTDSGRLLSALVMDYLRARGEVAVPQTGRLIPATAIGHP